MITIIHYGVGNISAFLNIFNELGIVCKIAKSHHDLANATKLILPGVGHFDYAMKKLANSGMIDPITELVLDKRIPILGVCVGMQMMANHSEEGQKEGLGWIDAEVEKIKIQATDLNVVLPHMGWNSVKIVQQSPLFDNIETDNDFYFLHSYYMKCKNHDNVLATMKYGHELTAVVKNNNVFGIQCHPEKSHTVGLQFLRNFAKL